MTSDLTLDVDFLEGGGPDGFEELTGFAGHECDGFRSIFQKMLTLIVNYKLGCISVRLEAEFFRNEPQFHFRLISKGSLALGV